MPFEYLFDNFQRLSQQINSNYKKKKHCIKVTQLIMNTQADLLQLILQKSPQVDNLRNRAISGNRDTFRSFLYAINKLLQDSSNHPAAYHQINQFLVSAQPSIVEQIDRYALPLLAQKHCRQDLDEYIVFWKNIMPGTGDRRVYPNLCEGLKNAKIINQHHNLTTLSVPFKKYNAEFLKNTDKILSKKFQFFQDFDDSIVSDSIDQGVSSEIIEMDMQQIKLIKQKVQNGPVDELTGQEFLKKIKNFLSLKPKTLRKQLSIDYNNDRIWAQQFLRNYDSFLQDGSLNLHKHFNPSGIKIDKVVETGKQVMGSSRTNINIHEMPQQIYYAQQPFKKQNSKRFQLTTQHFPLNPNFKQGGRQTQYHQPNQKLNIQLAGRKTQIPQFILNTDEIDRNSATQTYQMPRKDIARQNLSNPVTQPTYNMVNSQVDQMQNNMPNRASNLNNFPHLPPQRSPDRLTNNSMARSRQRPKIFGNSSMRSRQKQRQQHQEPLQGNLEVIKYKGQQPTTGYRLNYSNANGSQPKFYRHTINETPSRNWTPLSNQNQFNRPVYNTNQNFAFGNQNIDSNNQNSNVLLNPQMNQYSQQASVTPKNQKITGFYDTISPNTAFGNKTAYSGGTSYKKLSQFNREKKQRKMGLQNQELIPIQNFLVLPYCQNFNDMGSFSRFRRNCLQDNFTLYASPLLLISCIIKRESQNKIKAQILFHNQSHSNLSLQTLYRVPKCLKVEKYSLINKRWSLKDQAQHIFGLELLQFPLEPCLLNLKYALQSNYEDFKYHQPTIVSLPITMRNFLEYLVLNEQQWIQKWTKWTELDNFRRYRNIILQKQVLRQDELTSALKQFTILNPIQGYSVKQFGAYCRQTNFDNLTFLVRISQRIENIMTLELVADRKIRDEDYIDYLEYALNMWSMLLAKIDSSSMV